MNPTRCSLILLLLFTMLSQPQLAGQEKGPMSLQDLERAIDRFRSNGGQPSDIPIDLSGYSHHWSFEPGGGLTVVAISCNLNGYLLAFSRDGLLASSAPTGEVVSAQVCDLDEDGNAEIVLDEVKARGTGMLTREFHLYQVAGSSVKDLWHGTSFSHLYHEEGSGRSYSSFARGTIRCDPSGGGRSSARLVYATETDNGKGKRQRKESALEMRGGKVVEVASSP
jgi:hypothetical protein